MKRPPHTLDGRERRVGGHIPSGNLCGQGCWRRGTRRSALIAFAALAWWARLGPVNPVMSADDLGDQAADGHRSKHLCTEQLGTERDARHWSVGRRSKDGTESNCRQQLAVGAERQGES